MLISRSTQGKTEEGKADIWRRYRWFSRERTKRNEHRNSILMTCHYLDLDGASNWVKQISNRSKALPSSG